jgi:hypothetical protein
MKMTTSAFKPLAALALFVLAAGCATQSEIKSKQNLAVAADFKVITPSKPDQKALLAKLPKDKITKVTYHGKTYYVLPDLAHNQAYVGGPKQYQTYQQNNQALKQAAAYQQAETINQQNAGDSGNWGGWGGWGNWQNSNGYTAYDGNAVDSRRASVGWY